MQLRQQAIERLAQQLHCKELAALQKLEEVLALEQVSSASCSGGGARSWVASTMPPECPLVLAAELVAVERPFTATCERYPGPPATCLLPQALLAAMHYSRLVARRYGLLPWQALLQLRRQQAAAGATFSNHSCLRRAWVAWMAGLQQARWAAACSQACALAARRLERQRALLAAGLAALGNNLQQARSAAGVAWHWHTRRLVSLVSVCGRRATTIGRC